MGSSKSEKRSAYTQKGRNIKKCYINVEILNDPNLNAIYLFINLDETFILAMISKSWFSQLEGNCISNVRYENREINNYI